MNKKTTLRKCLLAWFRRNARDLPWRCTRDPFAVWVSEIMLQQTRVETVIDYYQRFLKAFPTLDSLAHASEDRVLKLWEGLGYYRRALNLHRAARIIVREHQGNIPNDIPTLLTLPGIGRYTAGAIASIAFQIPAPVVDGNVMRVLTRIDAMHEPIDHSATQKKLWKRAEHLVSRRSPGNFNQAIMELGARICLPKNPRCDTCPVSHSCDAYQQGIQHLLPTKKPQKKLPHYQVVAAAIKRRGRYLLGKRPAGGMLGGLWEFPGGKVERGESHQQALQREIREELGLHISVEKQIASVNHGYSHFTVTLHLLTCRILKGIPTPLYHTHLKWVFPSQFHRYSFPAANHKFLNMLSDKNS